MYIEEGIGQQGRKKDGRCEVENKSHFPRECHPAGVVCEVLQCDSGRPTDHLRDGVDMEEGTDDGGRQQ